MSGPFYTNYYTNALGKSILHRFGGALLHRGEHVRVGVQGDCSDRCRKAKSQVLCSGPTGTIGWLESAAG